MEQELHGKRAGDHAKEDGPGKALPRFLGAYCRGHGMRAKHHASDIATSIGGHHAQHEDHDGSGATGKWGRHQRQHCCEGGKKRNPCQHKNADGHIPQVVNWWAMATIMEEATKHKRQHSGDIDRDKAGRAQWPGDPHHSLAQNNEQCARNIVGMLPQAAEHLPHSNADCKGDDRVPRERAGPYGEHDKCAKAYANADSGRQIAACTILRLWQSAVYGITHRDRLLSLLLSRPLANVRCSTSPTPDFGAVGRGTEKAPPAGDGHGGNGGRS